MRLQQRHSAALTYRTADGLRLAIPPSDGRHYHNAQLDNYRLTSGEALPLRPPLSLRWRARFSHPSAQLRGTAGFGLWNYPWAGLPRLPRALWFFYMAAPGSMPLALDVRGVGWKAAALDTGRPSALALVPLAPVIVPLLNIPALYRRLWPWVQRACAIAETPLTEPLDRWQTYALEWGEKTARLSLNDMVVLETIAPRGPLSFVAWIDNQYAVIDPRGRFGWGLQATSETQWLEIDLEE